MAPRAPYYGGDGRLSMIAEDADYQPGSKAQPASAFSADLSSNSGGIKRGRPGSASHSSKGSGSLPRHSADTAPPGYTLWDVTGPKGEKFLDVRNNRHIAKRGGWKRILIVGIVLLILAIGLGVGLGVGLSRRNSTQNTTEQPAPISSQPADAGPFPQGSYTFGGNLVNISTSCTSVAATWRCWPYATYGDDAGLSAVAFNWVVSNASDDSTKLLISSSSNPFAIQFSNTSLTIEDKGKDTENYRFSIPLDKYVQPQDPLVPNGPLNGCWFRKTTLEGRLYTQKKADANANDGQAAARAGWGAWPGAFEVQQTIAGGKDVPSCYEEQAGGEQGPRVTNGLTDQASSTQCGCYWRDFDLA